MPNPISDPLKLDDGVAKRQVARLGIIPYFPSDPMLRDEAARYLRRLCHGHRVNGETGARFYANAQCEAVIDKAIDTLAQWEGAIKLREIHQDLFPPYAR